MKFTIYNLRLLICGLLFFSCSLRASATGITMEGTFDITQHDATLWYTAGSISTVTVYYGESDGGSNALAWAASTNVGSVGIGWQLVGVSNLTAGALYYFRASMITNVNYTNWSNARSFWTLSTAPTNLPATTSRPVLVNTNGVLIHPTAANLLAANPALGVGLSGISIGGSTNTGPIVTLGSAATNNVITDGLALSNSVTLFGGLLGGTNGVYFRKGTNNYWILFP